MDDMTNFQRNFSTGEVEVEDRAIYHVTEYRERRNHYAVWAVNRDTDGFDTDRESFFGLYNGFDAPRAVLEDRPSGSVCSGWAPIGAHRVRLPLAPGEERGMVFVLGYCENPEDQKFEAPGVANKAPARALMNAFRTEAQFDRALEALRVYWGRAARKLPSQQAATIGSTAWSTSGISTSAWSPSTCRARPPILSRASAEAWASAIRRRTCWALCT
jgi:cellobiose phosphorylase